VLTVTADDIGVELGRTLTDAETRQAEKWITQALAIITKKVGDIARLDPEMVEYVVVQMVAERFRRPADGATQVQVSVDDASSLRRFDTSAKGLMLRPEWIDLLTPEEDASQAFTIRPVGWGPSHAR
jgi:hypothetical protein